MHFCIQLAASGADGCHSCLALVAKLNHGRDRNRQLGTINALNVASADDVFNIDPNFDRRLECRSFGLPPKRLIAEIKNPQLRILRESELHGRFE